ncbi:hypothetical protein CL634_02300 [bacterium]|nr:hypothetical protein [bacterium]|tara:strand:- start:86 stop:403 length:318 start_codon:yes stop_codon:yes gene_type:complete
MKGGSIMLYDVETYSPHMEINVSKGLTLDEAKLELIKRRFGDPHREHGIRERELRRYVIIISHPPGTHAWLTDKFPPGVYYWNDWSGEHNSMPAEFHNWTTEKLW